METKKRSAQIKPSHASQSKSQPKISASSATTAAGKVDRSLTDRQIAILEKRGINLELAIKMGWRAGRKGAGDWIEIPYFRNGREVNCKSRTLSGDKCFHQVTGGEKCVYNVDAIAELAENTLVFTEGEMDCIIALDCGFIAVSVPDGAPKEAIGDKESSKYDYLKDITASVKKIVLAVDGDSAGINLLQDLAIRLGRHRCLWVKYPDGCKDLNDVFLKGGKEAVWKVITNAQFMRVDGLYLMSELPPLPEMPALDVGIEELKPHFKLRRGDLSVDTGIPSHGKTTVVNSIAFNMAKHHGWNVCFASFEQPPQTEHRRALRTLYNRKPERLQSLEEKALADKWIDQYFSFIVPSDDSDEWFDMAWLKDRMAAAVTQHITPRI